jgi:hypothetical protein
VSRIGYWTTTSIGRLLRGVFALILLVRRPRPIHSRGLLLEGTVTWRERSAGMASGISWIDTPPPAGTQSVTARLSRSIGLPPQLPDIIGLALRFDTDDGPADLELASTGFDVPGRFLLLPHRRPDRAWLGTLFPYRGKRGPILIAARSRRPGRIAPGIAEAREQLLADEWVLDLLFATPRSTWRRFAEVRLGTHASASDSIAYRFDAVRNPLPGADTYEWSRRVREPSYDIAQRD